MCACFFVCLDGGAAATRVCTTDGFYGEILLERAASKGLATARMIPTTRIYTDSTGPDEKALGSFFYTRND